MRMWPPGMDVEAGLALRPSLLTTETFLAVPASTCSCLKYWKLRSLVGVAANEISVSTSSQAINVIHAHFSLADIHPAPAGSSICLHSKKKLLATAEVCALGLL